MRTARIVDNCTLMATACQALDLPDGAEVLAVVIKATWEIDDGGSARLALVPRPVRRGGVRRHREQMSSLRYPSDLAPLKTGAEVVLVGSARPPAGDVTQMTVSLRLARGDRMLIDKSATVHGLRLWERGLRGVVPGPAQPLEQTELSWENTYGGAIAKAGRSQIEPRNPVGMGVCFEPNDRVGRACPAIEDPAAPLTSRHPAPIGFGAVSPGWQPRSKRYGTLSEQWRRERVPLAPLDFDPRFYCDAPDDQWVADPLEAGDNVEVLGVRAGRAWRFRLPPGRPRVICRTSGVDELRRPHLDTVLIDADDGLVELSWRSSFKLPRKSESVEHVRVTYDEPLSDEHLDDHAARYKRAGGGRSA